MWIKKSYLLILISILFIQCKETVNDPEEKPDDKPGYNMVWSDEFNGNSLDLTKWNFETGTGVNGDFGTGQIDRATNRPENVSIVTGISGAENGCLAITARKERFIDREYTSGRINTSGKGSWGPGYRIEAKIWPRDVKQKGQGFAFWMMPDEKPVGYEYLMWPQGGEIDIMEFVGSIPYNNLGSVHYAWWWKNNQWDPGNHGHKGAYFNYQDKQVPLQNPTYGGYPPPADNIYSGSYGFHIYAIEWHENRMEFLVDNSVYHIHYFNDGEAFDNGAGDGQDEDAVKLINSRRVKLSEYSNHFPEWYPFKHKFYIILSAGVGGGTQTYGGAITPEAIFPCSVYIDWVRVYKRVI
jgi:beta-glucanase (GH16 family)